MMILLMCVTNICNKPIESKIYASTIPTVKTGVYYIRNMKNGLYLDVDNAGTADGTNVQVWTANKSNAQKWKVIKLDSNTYILRTLVKESMALKCGGYSNAVTGYAGTSNSISSIADEFKWTIKRNNDGTIFLGVYSSRGSHYLDCYGGGLAKGTNVIYSYFNGNPSMRWILEDVNNNISVLGWNLVDSSGHIDWTSKTKYSKYVTNAIDTWNSYTDNIFTEDKWYTINDLTISDYNGVDEPTLAGYTTASGDILLNTYVIDSLNDSNKYVSDALKENIILHELGHAIGLDHTTRFGDVMTASYIVSYINPSINDVESYKKARQGY